VLDVVLLVNEGPALNVAVVVALAGVEAGMLEEVVVFAAIVGIPVAIARQLQILVTCDAKYCWSQLPPKPGGGKY